MNRQLNCKGMVFILLKIRELENTNRTNRLTPQSPQSFYSDIASLIDQSKRTVQRAVNDAMVMLYWNIGKYLVCTVFEGSKAEYGQKVVEELGANLSLNYGKGFEKSSLFRMIKFYREFPDFQKVAALSRQLTWSHFVILLPIKDESKRDFYAVMCKNENWNVRALQELRKFMLFKRTAI